MRNRGPDSGNAPGPTGKTPGAKKQQRERGATDKDLSQARVESARARAETSQARAEREQARVETSQARSETEKARAETEQARTDTSQARADTKQARTETELSGSETEQSRTETSQARSDLVDLGDLFQEVHHRVKNNLQILSSLVMVVGARFPDAAVTEALGEIQDRISAIGLVHDILYRRNKAVTIDLGEYVHAVADAVWASTGATENGTVLSVKVVACPTNMDTAVTVGLILTEVLTNVVKHAFPTGQKGSVWLTLLPMGEGWQLVAKDNGVGFQVEDAPAVGIGRRLVRTLAAQLKAEISFRSEDGFEFTLTFDP